MSKPSSHLDWTIGNPNFGTVTIEPTTGKKLTGWTPGEPPAGQHFNWILYNADQWDKYLETKTDNHETRLVTLENSLFSTNLTQEVPTGVADGSNLNFTLSQAPSNPANTFVFVDSALIPRNEYIVTGRNIIFNAGFAPAAGSNVMAIFVIQTGFSGQSTQTTTGGVGAGSTNRVETRQLTANEIGSAQLNLALAPYDGTSVLIDIIEDGPQAYGFDFTVSGNVVSWSGLGMAPAVSVGSILRIQYFV